MASEGQRERQQEDRGAFDYEFDLENPFTSPADEPIASLLAAEGQHSPSVIAVASDARRAAAGFIFKVRVRTPHFSALLFLFAPLLPVSCSFVRLPLFHDPIGLDRCSGSSAARSPCTPASPTSRSTTWIASSPSESCP
jgi:hypothetical protein